MLGKNRLWIFNNEEVKKILASAEEEWSLFYSFILKTGLQLGEC